MKILIPLILTLFTMSSNSNSNNDIEFDCFSDCEEFTASQSAEWTLSTADEFLLFSFCYDRDCGGSEGQFTLINEE